MNAKCLIVVLVCCIYSVLMSGQELSNTPNIVILFADDLGYSDLGCYGGEIETPNLDKLASEGIRFTQFMNCTKCAASRASLLTGQYPIEIGCNGEPTQMINSITIAEVLKQANYRTLMTGKWHAKENPVKRGFDRYYGCPKGGSNYFEPSKSQRFMDDTVLHNPINAENKDAFYTTDVYTDKAIDYLEEYKEDSKPFLLYVAYNAPHFPLQAWPEDVAKYRGKYMKGWDAIRTERFLRQQEMGIVKADWHLSERDENVEAWESFKRKDDADLTMATYAAMVDRMDQNIGRLLNKLDEIGASDNTLVLFLSDNGACAEGSMWDGVDKRTNPALRNSQAKLGIEWANACNAPYRKFKRYMYNGGQLTPFIARWPNQISDKGSISHQRAHLVDIAPTLIELTKADYPKQQKWTVEAEGNLKTEWKIQTLSGKSMVPLLKGEPQNEPDYYLGYFQGGRMIMKGNWKLVSDGSDGTVQHLYDYPWELYNMDSDASELNDLSYKYPEKVEAMDKEFRNWIDKCDEQTGIRSHKLFQLRYTKEQAIAAQQLDKDKHLQQIMATRKEIGLQIVDELFAEKLKIRTGLGMEKVPMSFFGIVEQGIPYKDKNAKLSKLYADWSNNIKSGEKYCTKKGNVFLEVWNIQERIRPNLPASDVL